MDCGRIDPSKKSPVKVNGRKRLPDALNKDELVEVKNAKYVARTLQLRDYEDIARETHSAMKLIVRAGDGTKVSRTLIQIGWEVIRIIRNK